MKKPKNKLIAKLLVSSLSFAALILTGTIVPLSCADQTDQNQNSPSDQPSGPSGNPSNPGGQSERISFAETNSQLNEPSNKQKSFRHFNGYVDAISPTAAEPKTIASGAFDGIPAIPETGITVSKNAAETVTTPTFANELVEMLKNGLEEAVPTGKPGYDLTAVLEQLEAGKKQIAAPYDSSAKTGSTWNSYFQLTSSGETAIWNFVYEKHSYTLYLPSHHLSLSYDDAGYPVLSNDEPTGADVPETERARLFVNSTQLNTRKTTFFFKPGTIALPKSLFGQFPTYYADVIRYSRTVQSKTQDILDSYKSTVESNKLGLSLWNQYAVGADHANSSYLQSDLAGTASKVLAWIKANAAQAENLTGVPETLANHQISYPSHYAPYYGGSGAETVFKATDSSSKKSYELHLKVKDFTFEATANEWFGADKPFVSVVPKIQLDSGSKFVHPENQSVEFDANTWFDASDLLDRNALSDFYESLALNSTSRGHHHDLIDFVSKTPTEKLDQWHDYVVANAAKIKKAFEAKENRKFVADFVVDNIDIALKDYFRSSNTNSSGSYTEFLFSSADELKQAITNNSTVTVASGYPNGPKAFAFNRGETATVSSSGGIENNKNANYAILIQTKKPKQSKILVYFGTKDNEIASGDTIALNRASAESQNIHLSVTGKGMKNVGSLKFTQTTTPAEVVNNMSKVPSILFLDAFSKNSTKVWGFVMGNSFANEDDNEGSRTIKIPRQLLNF